MYVLKRSPKFSVPFRELLLVRLARFHIGKRPHRAIRTDDKVHHEIQETPLRVFTKIIHPHEVRMPEPRQGLALGPEPLAERLDIAALAREDLERIAYAELPMLDFVHRTHAARS